MGGSGYAVLHHNNNLSKAICCLAQILQKDLVFKTFEKGGIFAPDMSTSNLDRVIDQSCICCFPVGGWDREANPLLQLSTTAKQ